VKSALAIDHCLCIYSIKMPRAILYEEIEDITWQFCFILCSSASYSFLGHSSYQHKYKKAILRRKKAIFSDCVAVI
jgi:hypothetical protein